MGMLDAEYTNKVVSDGSGFSWDSVGDWFSGVINTASNVGQKYFDFAWAKEQLKQGSQPVMGGVEVPAQPNVTTGVPVAVNPFENMVPAQPGVFDQIVGMSVENKLFSVAAIVGLVILIKKV